MDVEAWLAHSRTGGYHRRQVSALTISGSWNRQAKHAWWSINWWSLFAHLVTFWAPASLLRCFGYHDRVMRQAWREKIALCFVILLMCAALAFLTFGIGPVLCPSGAYNSRILRKNLNESNHPDITWIYGQVYQSRKVASVLNVTLELVQSRDISRTVAVPADSVCRQVSQDSFENACTFNGTCWDPRLLKQLQPMQTIAYEWADVDADPDLVVFDGNVVQLPKKEQPFFLDQRANQALWNISNKDVTKTFVEMGDSGQQVTTCLVQVFKIGHISKQTVGCFAFNMFQIVALAAIGTLILARFILAVTFSWFMCRQLDEMRMQKEQGNSCSSSLTSRSLPSCKEFPEVVMKTLQNTYGVSRLSDFAQYALSMSDDPEDDPYVILLTTCYSEGEASLRITLDALAHTDYHDHRKLMLVVADGRISGEGNNLMTFEIVRKMMRIESTMEMALPQSYISVADASRRHNMAVVYAGQYHSRGRVVPCILIAKCGTPEETAFPKSGNRGKRDSQLIVMSFMQRVIFNDRMTPLDFDLFNKICWLMGVPPDVFDIILMVDADTKVAVDSLGRMVNAMRRDSSIMGLCGETRIANKGKSWVSAIQVFEYYISHHLGKAFESVFGGVTCLPGCFCMYRIKVAKKGRIIPVLASPVVIDEYSQSVVDTLHKKNLLLLGEDRFLTTLMLKLFPKRKMMFVPQAYCKTFVPEEFRTLLSQRRRWINSTIHNLLELVLVPDLCGIFCFSMQFVVFIELIGTVVLPAAIIFTFVLIGAAIVDPIGAIIPLILLAMVLGLPAVLIVITTRKVVYIWWMIGYLLALPIWNFVLPVYAYWHFDDFSWGKTRKIAGADNGHAQDGVGGDTGQDVPMKTWIGWSRSLKAQENKK